MTDAEKEFIGFLEEQIRRWESEKEFFASVAEVSTLDGKTVSGRSYAEKFDSWIEQNRELIDRIRQ